MSGTLRSDQGVLEGTSDPLEGVEGVIGLAVFEPFLVVPVVIQPRMLEVGELAPEETALLGDKEPWSAALTRSRVPEREEAIRFGFQELLE